MIAKEQVGFTFKPDGTITSKKPPREREYVLRIAHDEQSSLLYPVILRIYDLIKGQVIPEMPSELSDWQLKQIREIKNANIRKTENGFEITMANKIAETKQQTTLRAVCELIHQYRKSYVKEWGFPYED